MLASPPPSLPASFPHMVLIRSGLRDSSQRKWLCTESFCKGRRGEGERPKRKKERKREEAEVGGGRSRPADVLPYPPMVQGLSCHTPCGVPDSACLKRGTQKKSTSLADSLHLPTEGAGGS